MNSRSLTLLMLVGASVASAPPARAHHSQSEFDLRAKIEVDGTVTKLEWKARTDGSTST